MKEPPAQAALRVELETKIGFLEHTVDALNEMVLEQDRSMEEFRRRLARLEGAVEAEGDESDPLDLQSEKPPHY